MRDNVAVEGEEFGKEFGHGERLLEGAGGKVNCRGRVGSVILGGKGH